MGCVSSSPEPKAGGELHKNKHAEPPAPASAAAVKEDIDVQLVVPAGQEQSERSSQTGAERRSQRGAEDGTDSGGAEH